MKTRKIPMRTCIVTHEKLPKVDLLRIVKNKELGVLVDTTGKVNGRGVYLKKDLDVLNRARRNKIIEKKLEVEVDDKIYQEIEEIISKEK